MTGENRAATKGRQALPESADSAPALAAMEADGCGLETAESVTAIPVNAEGKGEIICPLIIKNFYDTKG
ncbi:hypothetical protein NKH72_08195 [Mesorhizobium sp. M0955]|uniref:hypothetical protein n=1 Tax=unclassified Mesorhizobium TaxID=325217 RepID=UPI00333CA445